MTTTKMYEWRDLFVLLLRGSSQNMVCQLHKSLYGFKQSMSMVWPLLNCYTKFNLIHSEVDHSVFHPHSPKGNFISLSVDDIEITANDQNELSASSNTSLTTSKVKLGSFETCLSIEVAQSKNVSIISKRKSCS